MFYIIYLERESFTKFELRLVQMDSEWLTVPDTEYESVVTMSSYEFARICKEMSAISETGEHKFYFL